MVCTYAVAVENAWRSDTRCRRSWIGSARTHCKFLGNMQEQAGTGKTNKRSLLNPVDRVIGSPYARLFCGQPGIFHNCTILSNSVLKHLHPYKFRTSASANSIFSRDGIAFTSLTAARSLCSLFQLWRKMWLKIHGIQAVVQTLSSDDDRRPLKRFDDDHDPEYYAKQQAEVSHGTASAVSHAHCPGHGSRILT